VAHYKDVHVVLIKVFLSLPRMLIKAKGAMAILVHGWQSCKQYNEIK